MFPNHADTVTQCILTWSELTRYTTNVPLTWYDTARSTLTRHGLTWFGYSSQRHGSTRFGDVTTCSRHGLDQTLTPFDHILSFCQGSLARFDTVWAQACFDTVRHGFGT